MHVLAFFMMMIMAMIILTAAIFFDAGAMFLTDTILMLPAAVFNDMEHLLVGKKRQGAKDCTTIDGGQQRLKVAQRKGEVKLRQGAPNENADGCCPHTVIF